MAATTRTASFKFNLTAFDKVPWHKDEHNNWHIVDALLARYVAVSNVQGGWENALAVTVGQRYIDGDSDTIWEVLVDHTTASIGTFAADRANNPTYWQGVSVDVAFKGTYTTGTQYFINDFVVDNKRYGVVAIAHTGTTYDARVATADIITLIDGQDLVSSSPVVNTLAEGSNATVSYDAATGIFTFGIPVGATGATGAGTGDVVGPASATDHGIATFNGATGTILESVVALGTSGHPLLSGGTGADPAFGQIGTTGIAANAITQTEMSDDAIGLPELAHGTAGELYTFDATGIPAFIAAGTAAHVLTSNGAGAAPTFQVGPNTNTANLVGIQVLTTGSSATYTPTSGATSALVKIVGAGGGGGGADGNGGCIFGSGGGGGAGAYAEKRFDLTLAATGTYSVSNTGGAGGLSTPAAGSTGGNSSFTWNGVTVTCVGGTGGALGDDTHGLGGAGGTTSGGDFGVNGQAGSQGGQDFNTNFGSDGGQASGPFAGGPGYGGHDANGGAAVNYGSGGGGAGTKGTTNRTGGAGGAGLIVVYEFGP